MPAKIASLPTTIWAGEKENEPPKQAKTPERVGAAEKRDDGCLVNYTHNMHIAIIGASKESASS